MATCNCHKEHGHTNAFIDLNGIPYFLAEYLDKRTFQQLDRSFVKSGISIDQTEAMRAVVDINIDDIGRRCSDGLLAVRGNNTKQKELLQMIETCRDQFDNQLPTLRSGIALRINYQLESLTTGSVIRSLSEDFKIQDRQYYLDINPRNVDDNAIVVNFAGTIVSTVGEYSRVRDSLLVRITNIQMLYECCKNLPRVPVAKSSLMSNEFDRLPIEPCPADPNYYYYHQQMQHRHQIGTPADCGYGHEDVSAICPPGWNAFNRFYHFDNHGSDMIIHTQEINDPTLRTALIPCGTVAVNRTFRVNPAHRIIFRFSIWKNDVTVVNDTTPIAAALKIQRLGWDEYCDCDHDDNHECEYGHHHHHHHECTPDYDRLIEMICQSREIDRKQTIAINSLIHKVEELQDIISKPDKPTDPEEPTDPKDPTNPEDPTKPTDPDTTDPVNLGGSDNPPTDKTDPDQTGGNNTDTEHDSSVDQNS